MKADTIAGLLALGFVLAILAAILTSCVTPRDDGYLLNDKISAPAVVTVVVFVTETPEPKPTSQAKITERQERRANQALSFVLALFLLVTLMIGVPLLAIYFMGRQDKGVKSETS